MFNHHLPRPKNSDVQQVLFLLGDLLKVEHDCILVELNLSKAETFLAHAAIECFLASEPALGGYERVLVSASQKIEAGLSRSCNYSADYSLHPSHLAALLKALGKTSLIHDYDEGDEEDDDDEY